MEVGMEMPLCSIFLYARAGVFERDVVPALASERKMRNKDRQGISKAERSEETKI